jgi:hypothetical protein
VFISALFLVSPVFAFEQGVCGQTITESVTLTENITGCTGNGIVINANGITLDCQGHTISGNDVSDTNGVYNTVYNSTTLKNCIIRDFENGFYSWEWNKRTYNHVIENNTFLSNTNSGLYWVKVTGANVTNNTFSKNIGWYGAFYCSNACTRILFESNLIEHQLEGYGLRFVNPRDSLILNNIARYTQFEGIHLVSDQDMPVHNIIENNIVEYGRANGIEIAGGLYSNVTNNTVRYASYNGIVFS